MYAHKHRVSMVSIGAKVVLVVLSCDTLAVGGAFTVGGAIYTNLNDPLSSGLSGVTITIECDGGTSATTMTAGGQGLWSFTNVPNDICTVTPARPGYCFSHVDHGTPQGQASVTLTVSAAHQQQNQSIQFLATSDCSPATLGACCSAVGSCSMVAAENCAGRYLGDRLTCSGDPDDDGVAGCEDLCPVTPALGGVDDAGVPLGDLTGDCRVGLDDFQILQSNFTGPAIVAVLDGSQEVPPVNTSATGVALVWLSPASNMVSWHITFSGITTNVTAAHFHGPAASGNNAPPRINIGTISGLASPMIGTAPISDSQAADVLAGRWYVNVHSAAHLDGEIRAQVNP